MRRKTLIDRIPLAPVSAALMGAAVAFFLSAMPGALLERAVGATGLASLIAAANPPLGNTARVLVSAGLGLAAAALTWGCVTLADLIGRLSVPSSPGADESESNWNPPVEAPESPERRPLFAATDLGQPLAQQEDLLVAPEPPRSERAFDPLDVPYDDVLELIDLAPDEPVAAPPEPPRSLDTLSIPDLMARLEAGAERRAAKAPSPRAAPLPEPAKAFDGALRNALEELQRLGRR